MINNFSLPTIQDIELAYKRISNYIYKTPVLISSYINEKFGANFFFKCENLQITGSFKFRGAMNALSKLDNEQKEKGIVTFSSGNHAQAIALASNILGIKATIIMPKDAPKIKIHNTEKYSNCNIILYDRYKDNREDILLQFIEKYGMIPISSYDNNEVIAGTGTIAKELFEEVNDLDAVFMGLGGGGLLSGFSIYADAKIRKCSIYGVEPENGNDGQLSLHNGIITRINTPKTIADGAQTQCIGKKNFFIIKNHVKDILTVNDTQLIDCMKLLAEQLKIIVEPTGCLGLAAMSNFTKKTKKERIGIILTGSNIDLITYIELIKSRFI